MINKKELLDELEEEFGKMRKEMNLEITLDELDDVCFVRNHVLSSGFVPFDFFRFLCHRVNDIILNNWINFLHELIMPNPNSLVSMAYSKVFDKEDKENIANLLKDVVNLNTTHLFSGLKNDRELKREHLLNTLLFWKNRLKPELIGIAEKIKGSSEQ